MSAIPLNTAVTGNVLKVISSFMLALNTLWTLAFLQQTALPLPGIIKPCLLMACFGFIALSFQYWD